ncbi:uncharacterized protein J5F26_016162 isoform 2-T2 [Ciconia maguari]
MPSKHCSKKSLRLYKLHLRQKQEASGYPACCTDDDRKAKYIEDYRRKENVILHPEHIKKNPAKCQIVKLFLNPLWGKLGQTSNLPNTTIAREPSELYGYLFFPAYDVSSCDFIDEDVATVSWKYAKGHVTLECNANIFIACFTMVYKCLELYDLLDALQDLCLYDDTDFVIFVSHPGDWNPLLGDYLGELMSELPPDEHIAEFSSSGPKS